MHLSYKPKNLIFAGILLVLLGLGVPLRALSEAEHLPSVRLPQTGGQFVEVKVEIADSPATREKGLMFRETLAPLAGMLFVFPTEEEHVFWMKNTPLSLDMLFLDSKGIVVGAVEKAEPRSLSPRAIGKPSRYVLEVNGGFVREHRIKIGGQADLRAVLQAPSK